MRPLRIQTRVTNPIVTLGDGLHIDGIIAAGIYAMMSDDARDALPLVHEQPDLDLPIAKADVGDEWVWMASAAVCEWAGRGSTEVRRMTASDAMITYSDDKSLNIASGQFKGMDLRHEVRMPLSGLLTWYVVGDGACIADALSTIRNIGRLHNHGHGAIETDDNLQPCWTIEEDEDAHTLWKNRNMPAGFGAGPVRPTPIRPPYWCRVQFRPGHRVGS